MIKDSWWDRLEYEGKKKMHQVTAAWRWGKREVDFFSWGQPLHWRPINVSTRRSPAALVLAATPSPGPSDALMTPGRLAHSHPVDSCIPSRRCRPGTPQGHLCPWCMDPDRTGGRGMRWNMFPWWILLLFSQGFVFSIVQGELPFMSENNAAMLVNWWVAKQQLSAFVSLDCLTSGHGLSCSQSNNPKHTIPHKKKE